MPKAAIAKVAAFVAVVFTLLIGTALPAVASTGGATLADAKPWHYWIAFVILFSAVMTVLVMLPLQYYKRVYRLKHPKR
jgi:hypothetical protein